MVLAHTHYGSLRTSEAGAALATSFGISLSDGTANNTKATTYTDLIASTPFTSSGILIQIGPNALTADYLVDIAVGASSSEVNIIDNILFSSPKLGEGNASYYFPLIIPAGVRLSARCQSTGSTGNIYISTILFKVGAPSLDGATKCVTYGATAGSTRGTGLDPGASINTKPAAPYTQIVASTTNPIKQIMIVFGDRANNVSSTCSWLIDVAIGAASSEVDIFPNLRITAGVTTDALIPMVFGPFPCWIPTGTRLSARCQCSINDATDRLIDIIIYGMC